MNYNMINHFNSNIAVAYGINASIFIQALSQWTFNNLANKRHLHDGYCWSYNTLEAYETIFPWWSKRQLETLIATLVKDGLIVKGNYNKHKYDRTCWYALSYMAMEFYPELITQDNLKALLGTISPKWEMETPDFCGNTIMENHFTKMRNGIHQNVTPIPTINTTRDNISKDILENDKEDDSLSKQTIPSKSSKIRSTDSFDLSKLMADNPHDISEQMLLDWLEVRKTKKNKVTKTAWTRINRTLILIEKEVGVSPKVAFETMVANAWQSLEVSYFLKKDNHVGKGSDFPAYE